jgi:hypothetical protein
MGYCLLHDKGVWHDRTVIAPLLSLFPEALPKCHTPVCPDVFEV